MSYVSGAYIMTTNRCNLNCSYCYEKHRTGDMEWPVMKQLIDQLDSKWDPERKCDNFCDIALTMFGGEPMLNWPIVKQAIEYAQTKKTRFGFYILTNGTIWTQEIHDFLAQKKKEMCCRLMMQISVDGCERSHNETRKFANGKGSYELVQANAKKYHEIFQDLIVRQTIVPENIDHLLEDFCALASMAENISMIPIYEGDWAKALPKAERELDAIFWKYFEEQKVRPNLYLSLLNKVVMRAGDPTYKYKGCHAGKELIGVTTDGNIYPCHRFIAYREMFDYKLGDVWNWIDQEGKNLAEIDCAHFSQEKCQACTSRVCNRCYATNRLMGGDIAALPEQCYCDFAALNQKVVDKYSDRLVAVHKHTLVEWSVYKSPTSKRRAIQMANGEQILAEDNQDLIVQALTKVLQQLKEISNQNHLILLALKEQKEKNANPVC